MLRTSRSPQLSDHSFDGMLVWFSEMSVRGLLFHPDDDPAEIINCKTGAYVFSEDEAAELRMMVSAMFAEAGGEGYDAGLPAFRAALGQFDGWWRVELTEKRGAG